MAKGSAATLKIGVQMMDNFSRDFKNMSGTITSSIAYLKTAIGAGVAAYAIKQLFDAGAMVVDFVDGITDAADRTTKFAKQVSLNVETLQELQHSLQLCGVAYEDVNKALLQGERRLQAYAATGTGPGAATLERLGIAAQITSGKIRDSNQLLIEFSRLVTSGRANLADVLDIFGRSGSPLMVLFKEGPESIQAMQRDARELGTVMDVTFFENSEKYRDELLRLNQVWDGIKKSVVREILPDMISLIRDLRIELQKSRDVIVNFVSDFVTFLQFSVTLRGFIDVMMDIVGPAAAMVASPAAGLQAMQVGLRDFLNELERFKQKLKEDRSSGAAGGPGIDDDLLGLSLTPEEKDKYIRQYQDFIRDLQIARMDGIEKDLAELDRLYIQQNDKISEIYNSGAIKAEDYERGLVEATATWEFKRAEIIKKYQDQTAAEAQKHYEEMIRIGKEYLQKQREMILSGTDAVAGFKLGLEDSWKEMKQLGAVGYDAGRQIVGIISDINPLFDAIALKTGTVKDAFRSMGIDILRIIATVIARMIALKIVMSFLGGVNPVASTSPGASGAGLTPTPDYAGGVTPGFARTIAPAGPTASWGPGAVSVSFQFPNNLDPEGTRRMLVQERHTIEGIIRGAVNSQPQFRREIAAAARVV